MVGLKPPARRTQRLWTQIKHSFMAEPTAFPSACQYYSIVRVHVPVQYISFKVDLSGYHRRTLKGPGSRPPPPPKKKVLAARCPPASARGRKQSMQMVLRTSYTSN